MSYHLFFFGEPSNPVPEVVLPSVSSSQPAYFTNLDQAVLPIEPPPGNIVALAPFSNFSVAKAESDDDGKCEEEGEDENIEWPDFDFFDDNPNPVVSGCAEQPEFKETKIDNKLVDKSLRKPVAFSMGQKLVLDVVRKLVDKTTEVVSLKDNSVEVVKSDTDSPAEQVEKEEDEELVAAEKEKLHSKLTEMLSEFVQSKKEVPKEEEAKPVKTAAPPPKSLIKKRAKIIAALKEQQIKQEVTRKAKEAFKRQEKEQATEKAKLAAELLQKKREDKLKRREQKIAEKKAKKLMLKRERLKNDPMAREELDLKKPLHCIAYYVEDHRAMIDQAIVALREDRVKAMLPEALRVLPLKNIKRMCVEELDKMTSEQILGILANPEPQKSAVVTQQQLVKPAATVAPADSTTKDKLTSTSSTSDTDAAEAQPTEPIPSSVNQPNNDFNFDSDSNQQADKNWSDAEDVLSEKSGSSESKKSAQSDGRNDAMSNRSRSAESDKIESCSATRSRSVSRSDKSRSRTVSRSEKLKSRTVSRSEKSRSRTVSRTEKPVKLKKKSKEIVKKKRKKAARSPSRSVSSDGSGVTYRSPIVLDVFRPFPDGYGEGPVKYTPGSDCEWSDDDFDGLYPPGYDMDYSPRMYANMPYPSEPLAAPFHATPPLVTDQQGVSSLQELDCDSKVVSGSEEGEILSAKEDGPEGEPPPEKKKKKVLRKKKREEFPISKEMEGIETAVKESMPTITLKKHTPSWMESYMKQRMEILELELRAKAIKAMLKNKGVASDSDSSA